MIMIVSRVTLICSSRLRNLLAQDYVTVYDGYTTREPVILKFCGGGEPVPEAISSGPEILVEFTTSPYGTFLHPTPPHSLHGFQLEVQVRESSPSSKLHNSHIN